jgi:hypothetical protein
MLALKQPASQQLFYKPMPWPSRSPDLNPIEHVWDLLNRCVRSNSANINNLHELRTALIAEWNVIPQRQIQNIILGMRKRCRAVSDARGGWTRLINEHLYYGSHCAPYSRKCYYNMCINWHRSMNRLL